MCADYHDAMRAITTNFQGPKAKALPTPDVQVLRIRSKSCCHWRFAWELGVGSALVFGLWRLVVDDHPPGHPGAKLPQSVRYRFEMSQQPVRQQFTAALDALVSEIK